MRRELCNTECSHEQSKVMLCALRGRIGVRMGSEKPPDCSIYVTMIVCTTFVAAACSKHAGLHIKSLCIRNAYHITADLQLPGACVTMTAYTCTVTSVQV